MTLSTIDCVAELVHSGLGVTILLFLAFAACVSGVKTLRTIRGVPDMVWVNEEVQVPLAPPTFRESLLVASVTPLSCFCVWAIGNIIVCDHFRLFVG